MKRPDFDAEVNVVGTVNVLQAAQAAGAQVIFTSSGGAGYGECPGPVDESFPFLPLSAYGIAKKCGEEYLAGWNRIYGTNHIALRFANIFGPRQDAGLEGGVVAIFLERMARGDETIIFGDGDQVRDFVYVGDIVDALLAAVGSTGGPFNIGTGRETTVVELHRACAAVAGVAHAPRLEPARLGDVRRSVLDAGLAERELGWTPRTSLEDGLAPNLGVDAGGVELAPAKRGVPCKHHSSDRISRSAPGGLPRSSQASSPSSSSWLSSSSARCSSPNRCRTRCCARRKRPQRPRRRRRP